MSKEDILEKIADLRKEKNATSDFMDQLEIQDQIHNLEMKLNGVKPMDTKIDCIGCGS